MLFELPEMEAWLRPRLRVELQSRVPNDRGVGGNLTRYATIQRKWKAGQEGRRFNQFRRPKYLFSGLTKCGECAPASSSIRASSSDA